MSETATVLLAAFGGGLADAVLQPVVSHFLDRARAGERIRKRREQSPRRVLVGQMVRGRKLIEAWQRVAVEKDSVGQLCS